MGRSPKQGLDYFPLDTEWDVKMQLVKARFGLVGIGCMVELFKMIYHEGYALKWDEDTKLLFAASNHIDEKSLDEIISFAISKSLFHKGVYEKLDILTSSGIQKRWVKIVTDSARLIKTIDKELDLNIAKWFTGEEIAFTGEDKTVSNGLSGEFMPQRKGKESKEEDSKEKEESFPFSPEPSNQPKTTAGKDLDRIREHWNSQPALPKFRHLIISMPPDQTGPALRTLGTYTADEVIKAIDNYCQILGSSEHEAFPKFAGFPGFMKSGPDSYGDDAKPFDRCKIIKHEPEEDRTEREVRKAKEELAAIRARNKEAGR